jgi:hypothetical protein
MQLSTFKRQTAIGISIRQRGTLATEALHVANSSFDIIISRYLTVLRVLTRPSATVWAGCSAWTSYAVQFFGADSDRLLA